MKSLIILIFIFVYTSIGSAENETAIYPQLDGLNDAALLRYFDKLLIEDLIDLADMDSRYRELIATHIAIQKFHIDEKLLHFEVNACKDMKKAQLEDFMGTSIKICDPTTTLKLLRNFGHMISNIYLDFGFHHHIEDENIEINKYINQYCADTLRELQIQTYTRLWCNINTTDAWRNPFNNLTNLIVEVHFDKGYGFLWDRNLSEIFPSIRSMTFKARNQDRATEWIVQQFPHLEHITLERIGENELRLFELNPQIRSVEIEYLLEDIETLRRIGDILQNVEVIQFEMYYWFSDVVEFLSSYSRSLWPARKIEFDGERRFTFTRF